MTYFKSLGAVDSALETIETIGPALEAVSKVIVDPALPEIACLVLRLNKITEGKPPGSSCAKREYTSEEKQQGLGLSRIIIPLRTAVWARHHPRMAAVVGIGAVSFIWLAGYWMGKRRNE